MILCRDVNCHYKRNEEFLFIVSTCKVSINRSSSQTYVLLRVQYSAVQWSIEYETPWNLSALSCLDLTSWNALYHCTGVNTCMMLPHGILDLFYSYFWTFPYRIDHCTCCTSLAKHHTLLLHLFLHTHILFHQLHIYNHLLFFARTLSRYTYNDLYVIFQNFYFK